MSEYSWIEHMFRLEGLTISPKLHWLLYASDEAIAPYGLATEKYAILNLEWLQQQYPTLKCVPFARRWDRDDMFAVVVQDSVYKRGQVILFDIEDINYYVIETTFPSLDAWADDAWSNIDKLHEARSRRLT